MRKLAIAVICAGPLAGAVTAAAKTSHRGWPHIDGRTVINASSRNMTITGLKNRHNELLGGGGSDTIYGGNAGDVIWGDYKPGNQPTRQVDRIYAGRGNDFIYASHGTNYISSGGGADQIHAHFGRGEIHCGSANDVVYVSHASKPHYRLFGCSRVSFATLGY
jgi:Ca2+-binding RTX toxin-like protein